MKGCWNCKREFGIGEMGELSIGGRGYEIRKWGMG